MDGTVDYDGFLISELKEIRREIAYSNGVFKIPTPRHLEMIALFDRMDRDLDIVLDAMSKNGLVRGNCDGRFTYESLYSFQDIFYKDMCHEAVMWVKQPAMWSQEIFARKAACMYLESLQRASQHIHELAISIEK